MFAIALIVSLLLTSPESFANRGYGQVNFANSGSPAAQADFLDGLALLHDFEYAAAAAAFRRAQAADPGFAMAYWGEAMTFNHPIWMQQDLKAARASLNKLAPTAAERRTKAKTDREKEYLDAVEILYGDGNTRVVTFPTPAAQGFYRVIRRDRCVARPQVRVRQARRQQRCDGRKDGRLLFKRKRIRL